MPRELPLLCTGSVIRNILAGLQTEDRRLMRTQPIDVDPHLLGDEWWSIVPHRSPFGAPGDLLYVRETWAECGSQVAYRADDPDYYPGAHLQPWRPSTHMPKRLARLWLRVEDVWVERVQEITEAGAGAEGAQIPVTTSGAPEGKARPLRRLGVTVEGYHDLIDAGDYCRAEFAHLWSSLYPGSWERNEWVFACRHSVVSTTGRPA